MANFWPKEALERLGRPLLSWDECPTCGEVAKRHFYGPTGVLLCPSLKGSEPQAQPPDERQPLRVPRRKIFGRVTLTAEDLAATALAIAEDVDEAWREQDAKKANRKGHGMEINPFQKRGYFDGD